jgi:hypothetical protein
VDLIIVTLNEATYLQPTEGPIGDAEALLEIEVSPITTGHKAMRIVFTLSGDVPRWV